MFEYELHIVLGVSLLLLFFILLSWFRHRAKEVEIGENIYESLSLYPRDLLRGTAIEIESVKGKIKLKIPPLSKAGSKLRLKGLGRAHPKSGKRGNLIIELHLEEDEQWSPEVMDEDLWLLSMPLLTMELFEDVLANLGQDLCQRRVQSPLILLIRYRGRVEKDLFEIESMIAQLNRSKRKTGRSKKEAPTVVALLDDRSSKIKCPSAEGFIPKIASKLSSDTPIG